MKEIADEMGQNLISSDIKLLDSNSMMSKMLNSWKTKTEENYMLQKKVEEAARLENLYASKPGALINELLRRVKSLEYLLKGFEGESLGNLHRLVSDEMIKRGR